MATARLGCDWGETLFATRARAFKPGWRHCREAGGTEKGMGVEIHTPLPSDLREERLLTPQETARLLAVRVETLERWRYSGHRGPAFVKVEGRIKYPLPVIRHYLAERTRAWTPGAPFYRRTRIEELGEKHPGLCEFVEQAQRRRIPNGQIAAEVLARWGEKVSLQVLSNFYRLRVWRKESSERGEGRQ